jgi:phosphohistidine phosphatase SixA
VASALGVASGKVQVCANLTPDDPPGPLFDALAKLAGLDTVLVTGHAPHLDVALRYALDRGDAPLSQLKKAGAACVELERAGKAGGTLAWLLSPSVLRALAHAAK